MAGRRKSRLQAAGKPHERISSDNFGKIYTISKKENLHLLVKAMLEAGGGCCPGVGPLSWRGGWATTTALLVERIVESSARSFSVFSSTSAKGSASPSKSGRSKWPFTQNNFGTVDTRSNEQQNGETRNLYGIANQVPQILYAINPHLKGPSQNIIFA